MEDVLAIDPPLDGVGQVSTIFRRERRRLLDFIGRRVRNRSDAEDVLQDVFYKLVESYELLKPVEHVSAWLYQAARNRIIDLFRKDSRRLQTEPLPDSDALALRSQDPGPAELLAEGVLLDEIRAALDELPEEQRAIFIAHEWEGREFRDIARETGTNENTLISRKRYAVKHLRQRLQAIYEEVTES